MYRPRFLASCRRGRAGRIAAPRPAHSHLDVEGSAGRDSPVCLRECGNKLRNGSEITCRTGNAGTARKSPPWAPPGLRSMSRGRFAFSLSRANFRRNADTRIFRGFCLPESRGWTATLSSRERAPEFAVISTTACASRVPMLRSQSASLVKFSLTRPRPLTAYSRFATPPAPHTV